MMQAAVLLLLGCAQNDANVTDTPAPGAGAGWGCVGWRQTGGCRSDGPREEQYDQDCDTEISVGWSGYCECDNGQNIGYACGQASVTFTCKYSCANPPPPPTPSPPIGECEPYPPQTKKPTPTPVPSDNAVENPEEYVNIRWGTKGGFGKDQAGSLYPQVVSPWGFNAWSIVTDDESPRFFNPWDWQFNGIRCTHQPSPWLYDWGNFLIFPMMVQSERFQHYFETTYNPDKSEWHPYLFKTSLTSYATEKGQTEVELSSTNHGAAIRVTYPVRQEVDNNTYTGYNDARKLLYKFPAQGAGAATQWDTSGEHVVLEGSTVTRAGGALHTLYYSIEVMTNATLMTTEIRVVNDNVYAWVIYANDGHELDVRVATSLISVCQARHNRITELSDRAFDDVVLESKLGWRDVLSKVDVRDLGNQAEDKLGLMYTALYRASLYPRFISEVTREGQELHKSTYVDELVINPGPLVTDSGSWDAYIAVYPLLSLVQPEVLGRMIQGWSNAYNESGVLPQWASPGHRNSMVGTMSDAYFADAIVNDIKGFDIDVAYEAIRNDAFGNVRAGMDEYTTHGYVRSGESSVSVSLNHMMADWAVAQAAKKLGKMDDYNILMARSLNYSKLFNNETGFFQARGEDGFAATKDFDQFRWGGDYTEAGPWQFRFYAPHDPKGLAEVYRQAGLDMCDKLQEAMTVSPAVHIGTYHQVIHEMSEMVNNVWGQYAHNNQPSHHMLYMMIAMSEQVGDKCSQLGQAYLRRTVTEAYRPSIDMYPGDEDNGEMSAWFVLSSLGLFQLAPGSGEYTLGIPLFKEVAVKVADGKELLITTDEEAFHGSHHAWDKSWGNGWPRDHGKGGAHNTRKFKCRRNLSKRKLKRHGKCLDHESEYDPTAYAVKKVAFNGKTVTGTSIKYADLMQGGHLRFFLQSAEGVRGN